MCLNVFVNNMGYFKDFRSKIGQKSSFSYILTIFDSTPIPGASWSGKTYKNLERFVQNVKNVILVPNQLNLSKYIGLQSPSKPGINLEKPQSAWPVTAPRTGACFKTRQIFYMF